MQTIKAGRFTADHAGPLVVFVIGLRINRVLKPAKWLPAARAMGPMIAELSQDPASGFLGAEFTFQPWRTVMMVQYWRDFDSLERYARAGDRSHLPAWAAFNRMLGNRAVGGDGSVGIFHETYVVPEHGLESVYVNMPAFGLGKVAGTVPISDGRRAARARMNGDQPPVTAD